MADADLIDVNAPVDIGDTTVQNRYEIAASEGPTLSTSATEITGTRIDSHPGGELLLIGSIDFRCAKAATSGEIYEGAISVNGTTVATLHQSTRSLSDDPTSPAHNSGQAQGMAIVRGVAPNTPIYLTAKNASAARGRWGTETSLQWMQLGDGEVPVADILANAEINAAHLDRVPLDDNGRQAMQASSGALTLTGSLQRPTNCYFDTPRDGSWLAIGTFDFTVTATSDAYAVGAVCVDGALVTSGMSAVSQSDRGPANTSHYGSSRATVMAFALTGDIPAGSTIELMALMAKTFGASPVAESGHTKLAVFQIA